MVSSTCHRRIHGPEDLLDTPRTHPPQNWLEIGARRIKKSQQKNMPGRVTVDRLGHHSAVGLDGVRLASPFRSCLECGVAYGPRTGDYVKLATLGAGGRSTSTTILGLSAIRHLRERSGAFRPAEAAQLQRRPAGRVAAGWALQRLRPGWSGAGRTSPRRGKGGSRRDWTTWRWDRRRLQAGSGSRRVRVESGPQGRGEAGDRQGHGVTFSRRRPLHRSTALADHVPELGTGRPHRHGVRASRRLLCRRGRSGRSHSLPGRSATRLNPTLPSSRTPRRLTEPGLRAFLDYLRRELAIKSDPLDAELQEQLKAASNQHLRLPWAIDEYERLDFSSVAYPRPRSGLGEDRTAVSSHPAAHMGPSSVEKESSHSWKDA